MEALVYDPTPLRHRAFRTMGKLDIGAYLTRFSPVNMHDLPDPEIKGPGWVRIKTVASGIFDPDLRFVLGRNTDSIRPFISYPFVPGSENCGIIDEVGDGVKSFRKGDRVVVYPYLSCEARNIDPVCGSCAVGDTASCINFAEGTLSPGISIGCCADTGGGWSESFLAHQSQLLKLPPEVDDDQAAAINVFAAGLHPVLRFRPDDRSMVLVYGCGAVGLSVIAAIRAVGSGCTIIALEDSELNGNTALSLGADRVIYPKNLKRTLESEIADATRAKQYGRTKSGLILSGGFDIAFDTIRSEHSVDNSLKFIAGGGSLVLVGNNAEFPRDASLAAFKGIRISFCPGPGAIDYQSRRIHSFPAALDMIRRKNADLRPLLTHKFNLKDFRNAFVTAVDCRSHRSIYPIFFFKS